MSAQCEEQSGHSHREIDHERYPPAGPVRKHPHQNLEGDGGKAFAVRSDVSKSADAEAMVAATIEQFGPPNVVYNNAGIEGVSDFLALMSGLLRTQIYIVKRRAASLAS